MLILYFLELFWSNYFCNKFVLYFSVHFLIDPIHERILEFDSPKPYFYDLHLPEEVTIKVAPNWISSGVDQCVFIYLIYRSKCCTGPKILLIPVHKRILSFHGKKVMKSLPKTQTFVWKTIHTVTILDFEPSLRTDKKILIHYRQIVEFNQSDWRFIQ